MVFELVLMLAAHHGACQIEYTTAVSSPSVPAQMFATNGWGQRMPMGFNNFGGGNCITIYPGRQVVLGDYSTYMGCMRKVAAIGEEDNVNAICRVKK